MKFSRYTIRIITLGMVLSVNLSAQDLILADIPIVQDGNEIQYPFVGGMSSSQFSEIDLDRDGVMDLFVFDRVGNSIATYLYDEDSPSYYRYAPEYIDQFPRLNDWAFIRDYNGDGIPDIVASDLIPTVFGVQVFRGRLDGDRLAFDLIELNQGMFNVLYFEDESFNTVQMEILSGDLPSVVDADGDGDLDILDYDGTGSFVEFMQNMSVERGFGLDTMLFKRTDRCWGKFFEAGSSDASILLSTDPNNCYTSFTGDDPITFRHVGSSVSAFDHNSDGLMDVLIGDVSNDNLIFLKNTGTANNAYMSSLDENFPSNSTSVDLFTFPAAYFIDVNHDGLQDFIAAPNEYLRTENRAMTQLYFNVGTATDMQFAKQSDDFLVGDMIDVSSGSRPAIVDYNADGLWDMVIGTYGTLDENDIQFGQLFLYENTGTATSPEFTLVDEDYLDFRQFGEMNFYLTPTFGDLDGDGDQDLLMGNITGRLIYFENLAGAGNAMNFGLPQFNYKDIDVGNHANPAIVDVDQDGLMDLVIGEENGNNNPENTDKCSHLSLFRNIGSAGNPMFDTDVNSANNMACFGNVRLDDPMSDRKGFASPQVLELDDELLLLTGSKFGEIKLFKNLRQNLNGTFDPTTERFGNLDAGDRTHPLLWDLDDDDLLELIVGNLKGGIQIYHTGLRLDQLLTSSKEIDELAFNIFPNPARMRVQINGEFSSEVQYHLFSIEGKLVSSGELPADGSLDISSIHPGFYTIKLSERGANGVGRFIKN